MISTFPDGKGLQFWFISHSSYYDRVKMYCYDSIMYMSFIEGKDSSPLTEIMGKGEFWNRYMQTSLLVQNETYNKSQEGKTTVNLKDKLEKVYVALFIHNYQRSVDEINIGELSFNKETKRILMQTVSLLSGFADYS